MTIKLADYWMGRDTAYRSELTPAIKANAADLLARVNKLLVIAKRQNIGINSGWRPAAVNAGIKGAAKKSNHMLGKAIDLSDADGSMDAWCLANLEKLAECGLWMETPSKTPRWCHLQSVPPRSGSRVFTP